jgi:hypothetical protein
MSTKAKIKEHLETPKEIGKDVANKVTTNPLTEHLMRLGYIARGLVYGVIGLLALKVALGESSRAADQQGAIAAMGDTPLGKTLLYVVFVGLIGYALWGVIRALLDPLHKGTEPKGIVERVAYAVSGVSYGVLAYSTYRLLTNNSPANTTPSQTAKTQKTAASLLDKSWGPWVVGLIGLVVIGAGLVQIGRGIQRDFDRQFKPYALSRNRRQWIDRIGRFGTVARGIVFLMIGLFLTLAAYHHDPQRAQGIAGVLTDLLHQPYGPWLLGVVALGLIAFGFYSGICGWWLRLKRTA